MELSADIVLVRDFAIALAIGALVGVEREKNREQGGQNATGLRSFMLIAETGAIAAWLAQQLDATWLVGAALLALALVTGAFGLRRSPLALDKASGERSPSESSGITTAIAALTVYLLGVVTLYGNAELAVTLAITTSAILAYREPMHGLVRKLGTEDLYAGLKLLIATFIILPLLPNRTIDPWDAFNPFRAWSLVVLISGLSLIGYIAMRWLGSSRGTALTALAGGLVSSTAVTLSFARRSREQLDVAPLFATGILIAWSVMYMRVIAEIAVVHAPLLATLFWPLLTLTIICVALTLRSWRHYQQAPQSNGVAMRNPFSLVSATQFALFFTAILFIVKLTQLYLPGETLYGVAALAGFAEVDAVVLSIAGVVRDGGDSETAGRAILLATLTNTWTKTGLVLALAAPALRRNILLGAGAITTTTLILLLVV